MIDGQHGDIVFDGVDRHDFIETFAKSMWLPGRLSEASTNN